MKKVCLGNRRKVMVPAFLRWLFPVKEKRISLFYKLYEKNDLLYLLFQSLPVLTFINWGSQGLPAMSRPEKTFHLLFEALVFVLCLVLLPMSPGWCFLVAHTISWLLNSHFWVLVRFWNIRFNTAANYYGYLMSLSKRLQDNDVFLVVVLIGGVAVGRSLTDSSDLDVKFIARKGTWYSIRANLVLMREKWRAFFLRIPFDANLYTDMDYFERINQQEMPYMLYRHKTLTDNQIAQYKMRNFTHE
jgi:hypothetical protein